jgi:hypothetical protein
MKYFYEDLENQKRLYLILQEWLGTPFRHKAGVKHFGCDCIHLVARVCEEMGVLEWKDGLIPNYPFDWHLHNTRGLMEEGIEENLNVEKLDIKSQMMNGDIILYKYGKAASHSGIFFDGYVYQSLTDVGVVKLHAFADNVFKKRLNTIYRILAQVNNK